MELSYENERERERNTKSWHGLVNWRESQREGGRDRELCLKAKTKS